MWTEGGRPFSTHVEGMLQLKLEYEYHQKGTIDHISDVASIRWGIRYQ